MSLDGYVTGPDDSRERPLGEGGEPLHAWLQEPMAPTDREFLQGELQTVGAVVMGRRSYAVLEGSDHGPVGTTPCFVLTHTPPKPADVEAPEVFTFVTDGIETAVEQAKAVAGGKKVALHGASPVQQALKAGIIDEITISLAPVLLGGGTRLFENLEGVHVQLERLQVVMSPGVTHLRFRVRK